MSTRKLLLADDSITIQKVVNLTFADEGIEVIAVGNGDAAMEKMAEVAPDLVMADINMPGLSGYQVCERIKQNDALKNTPVILLVGSFEPFDEEEAKRVGANDFLTKPFQSIRQLVSKVTVLLDANDRSAANLYDQTANNSFADTLDMNEPEITDSDQANDLGDAGMDDEMIQSTPVSSFALDESAKFETRDFASYEDSDDDKKTQPLSVYDLKEFSFVAGSSEKESEPQVSENADTNESEVQNYPENADINDSEPGDFAENKIDEPESTSPDFIEHRAAESRPDAQNFYESVLEESDVNNEKKEDFSSFLNYSDDDLLEIPFDEDDEWETEETAEKTENNSPESTEPVRTTEENEQDSAVEGEAEKTDEQFAGQDEITEETEENSPVEIEEEKSEESSEEQDASLIEELPQPESFEETFAQESGEYEEIVSQETDEDAQTEESGAEIPADEFINEFRQESDGENIPAESEDSDDENSSPETIEEVSQDENARSEFVEPEDSYHSENEIVVGSLIEPENNETESASEEEKTENPVENQTPTESANQFSPELIDAVARRVVEMLSDQVVREIAWEVVPQHADLVIKKAVEEKFAEETLKE